MSILRNQSFIPCLAICTSIAALVLTSLSAFACWFISVDLTTTTNNHESNNDNPLLPSELSTDVYNKYQSFGFGLWSRETTNVRSQFCILYSNYEKDYFFDGYWKTSRAMSLIAAILGVLCLTATILHACTGERIVNRNLLPCYCVTALFQALSFLAYGSSTICKSDDGSDRCNFGRGSTMGVVATVLFVLTGIFHFCIYKKVVADAAKGNDESNNVSGQEQQQQQDDKDVSQQVQEDNNDDEADGAVVHEEAKEEPLPQDDEP